MEESLVEYKKGQLLFREGEDSKDLYIVQSGQVKVFQTQDSVKIPIAVVTPGQFVGELSFFDGKPRSASAEAATDVKVIRLDKVRLDREIKQLPSWLLVLIRSIADRVRHGDELLKRNKVIDAQVSKQFQELG